MKLRLLLGLLLTVVAQGDSTEATMDRVTFNLPLPEGMVDVDRQSAYYKAKTRHFSPTQLLAVLHEHRGDDCVELIVARTSTQTAGQVTTPNDFLRIQFLNAEETRKAGERYLLHRGDKPGDLFTIVQANGKMVTCFLFHIREEEGRDRAVLPPSDQDERKLLAFTQALIAANPPLTSQQSAERNTTIGLMVGLFLVVAFLVVAYFRSLKRTTRATPPPLEGIFPR
jgi:hypothetical protein